MTTLIFRSKILHDGLPPESEGLSNEEFKLGEQTGQKADPASAARAMVSAKDASGKRLFTSDDFLSASQIAGFFPRRLP